MTSVAVPERVQRRNPHRRSIVVWVAYAVVALFVLDAIFWPLFVPHSPLAQNLANHLRSPGSAGLFGTDELGRDEFSRVLAGVRPVLEIVIASVAIGAIVGLLYGLIAGASESWVGTVMARVVDMILSIPGIVLAILLAFVLRPGIRTSIIVIAVVTWPGLARLVRGEVIGIRHSQFVESGVVSGLTRRRILTYHVLPNILNSFVPFLVLAIAVAIQVEAGLSFVGYGVQAPTAELGSMLAGALTYLNQWWLAVFPGIALTILILSITFVGQDVRDRLDPRRQTGHLVGPLGAPAKTEVEALSVPAYLVEAAPTEVPVQEIPASLAKADEQCQTGAHQLAESSILRLTGLTIEAERTGRHVVDNVTVDLRRGGVLAVVGESGSGKSSLCLSMLGLLSPGLRVRAGVLDCDGHTVDLAGAGATSRLRALRGRLVGLVLQDPLSSLDPVRKIRFQLNESRQAHGLSRRWRARAERRTWELGKLRDLGFSVPDHTLRSYPSTLSGGMRQRVCIGIASSADPLVVLADEPTSALDASLRGRVLRLLLDMCRANNTSLMFVTHDLTMVRSMAEQVMVMYGGMVLEEGPTSEVFRQPLSPYTQALLAAAITVDEAHEAASVPTLDDEPPEDRTSAGCPFLGRCPRGDDICEAQRPVLRTEAGSHRVACWHVDNQTASPAAGAVKDVDAV